MKRSRSGARFMSLNIYGVAAALNDYEPRMQRPRTYAVAAKHVARAPQKPGKKGLCLRDVLERELKQNGEIDGIGDDAFIMGVLAEAQRLLNVAGLNRHH